VSLVLKAAIGRQARLSAIVGSFFLTACSSIPSDTAGEEYALLPTTHELSHLPFYPQIEDQCGPASLATMLSARDIFISPESLREKIYIPGKEGSLTTEIVARARKFGMLVYPLQPELPDILKEISVGNPVLVMQNLGYNWLPRWHFSVVIGYDLERRTVILRSGNEKSHEVTFDLFLRTWQRAARWAVVITKPEELPGTADESVYINAANELEQVGEFESALSAYETALERWPGNTLAYFGAANSAYALDDFGQAYAFYSLYLQLRPDSAEGWNNLAYSLMQMQCPAQSLAAINCALLLEPENGDFRGSLKELSNQGSNYQATACPVVDC